MINASIIIRTKNEGRTLAAALQAVREQTRQIHELIVVDSGSTDNTLEIAQAFSARILHIAPNAFTYGRALNLGLAAASGDVAISLAGHAVPANAQWLTQLLAPFHNSQVAGAASRQLTRHRLYRSWALALFDQLYRTFRLRSQAITRRLYVNSCSAIRLRAWQDIQFAEDLPSCEDQLWAIEAIRNGWQIAYCPASLVYHEHPLSLAQKWRDTARDARAMREVARAQKHRST